MFFVKELRDTVIKYCGCKNIGYTTYNVMDISMVAGFETKYISMNLNLTVNAKRSNFLI